MLLIGRATWEICFSPIRSTTQIWVVTRHLYGISALVSQKSFRGETSGGVAKCRLLSQAMAHAHLNISTCKKFEHRVASLRSLISKREGNRKFLLIQFVRQNKSSNYCLCCSENHVFHKGKHLHCTINALFALSVYTLADNTGSS